MPAKTKTYSLDQSPLYRLTTKRRLAALLKVDERQIRSLLKAEVPYREWDELTAKGKLRHIEDPAPPLKDLQTRLAKLLSRIAPPQFLYCPVKKRSYLTNALRHVGNPSVRTLDLRDYFRATLSRRVFWFYHTRLQCSVDAAGILTKLSTTNGHLPTGSPLSPILSYFAHVDMWERIERIALEASCVLTVYMDDLTLSGARVSGDLMWRVKQEIYRCGLRYHKEKHYEGVPAEVTGIMVLGDRIELPHRKYRKMHLLREDLRHEQDSDAAIKLALKLSGHQAQIAQVKKINQPQKF